MLTLFGPGVLQATPQWLSGAAPVNFAMLASASFDKSFSVKAISGQFQAPIRFGRGALKYTAKVKIEAYSPAAAAYLFWGVAPGTGGTLEQFLEAGTVPSETTYVVTVANSATFSADLGVTYAATGKAMKQVASDPTAGQYTVAAGVYTFAAADAGKAVLISYTYTVTTGFSTPVVNQLQGVTPTFSMVFYNFDSDSNAPMTRTFPYVTAEKESEGFKADDFMQPEMDLMIGANAAGTIVVDSYSEVS